MLAVQVIDKSRPGKIHEVILVIIALLLLWQYKRLDAQSKK